MLTGCILFAFYTIVCLFFIYRFSLKASCTLSFNAVAIAFFVRLVAGCFYGYFFLHISTSDKDILNYHLEGLKQYALLKAHPTLFFTQDLFPNGYKTNQLAAIFNSNDSFAKDIELTLLFKLTGLFNLLSGGRYFVNTIFYNAIVFSGTCFLFKMVAAKFPEKRNAWFLLLFFFPPLLFWTSGIRKDGLCFAIICLLIFWIYFLCERKVSVKSVLLTAVFFIILFLLRNYVALSFLPLLFAYFFGRKSRYPLIIFSTVFSTCIALFFLSSVYGAINLPQKMADRQHAFMQLSGNSYLPLGQLNGSWISYIKTLPAALNHVFIRPYLSEANNVLYVIALCEILFFFFCLIRIFIKPARDLKLLFKEKLLIAFAFLAMINYVIIGFTVPFLGAIVRYKSSFEIFFLIVFIQLQNTDFLDKLFNKKLVRSIISPNKKAT